MSDVTNRALDVVREQLSGAYASGRCDWDRFYRPRWERGNFATRYHLVYPALAYFVLLKDDPAWGPTLRPQLDAMYRGLCERGAGTTGTLSSTSRRGRYKSAT